ncbi:MAG: 50S ribosomal protein L28 [Candidatus Omnitrophota bacterium]
MSKICEICGKGPVAGRQIVRKGLAKKKGGVGKRVVRVSKRTFYPNLQKVRAKIGTSVKTIKICTACLRSGKIQKA